MSIDTVDELVAAWTADMRDESKDETARERWLRAQLAAERKRREGLEDELHLERLAHTAAVTRADQAERERDAEREAVGLSAEDRDSAIQRAEQAERERDVLQRHYDAAAPEHNLIALLDLYHERQMTAERERDAAREGMFGQQRLYADVEEKLERAEADNAALLLRLRRAGEALARGGFVDLTTGGSHPGAAMLERMRVLESIAQQIIEHWETKPRAGMACIVMEARMALKETP